MVMCTQRPPPHRCTFSPAPPRPPHTPLSPTTAAWESLLRNLPDTKSSCSPNPSSCRFPTEMPVGRVFTSRSSGSARASSKITGLKLRAGRLQDGRHQLIHVRWSAYPHQALCHAPHRWCPLQVAEHYDVGIITPILQMGKPRLQRLLTRPE